MAEAFTKPCEFCGTAVTKTKREQGSRKYWTCSSSCANKQRIRLGNTHWSDNPLRGRKDTRPCAICEKPVTRYLSQVNNRQTWTCSRSCGGTLRYQQRIAAGTWKVGQKKRRGITTPCDVCGIPVYATQTQRRMGSGRYCSQTCHNVAQSKPPVIKNCAQCGMSMTLKPSQAIRVYCSRSCMGLGAIKRPLDRNHNGRPARLDQYGYVLLWEPTHPSRTFKGWQHEHRLVAEKMLGRYLLPGEEVDHVNRNRADNRPENLQVLTNANHLAKTQGDNRQDRIDLAEYRHRYGSLKP